MEIFWIFLGNFLIGFFWEDIFWGAFFGRYFLGGFFGRIFWEEFFGRNTLLKSPSYLNHLNLKGIDALVKILSQGKKEGKFKSLEVRVQAHRT